MSIYSTSTACVTRQTSGTGTHKANPDINGAVGEARTMIMILITNNCILMIRNGRVCARARAKRDIIDLREVFQGCLTATRFHLIK